MKATPPAIDTAGFILAVHAAVRAIPRGRVATYGQVATLAGWPRRARMVARALRQAPIDLPLPWHRVINAQGGISLEGSDAAKQRARLLAEGVRFKTSGRVDLRIYGL